METEKINTVQNQLWIKEWKIMKQKASEELEDLLIFKKNMDDLKEIEAIEYKETALLKILHDLDIGWSEKMSIIRDEERIEQNAIAEMTNRFQNEQEYQENIEKIRLENQYQERKEKNDKKIAIEKLKEEKALRIRIEKIENEKKKKEYDATTKQIRKYQEIIDEKIKEDNKIFERMLDEELLKEKLRMEMPKKNQENKPTNMVQEQNYMKTQNLDNECTRKINENKPKIEKINKKIDLIKMKKEKEEKEKEKKVKMKEEEEKLKEDMKNEMLKKEKVNNKINFYFEKNIKKIDEIKMKKEKEEKEKKEKDEKTKENIKEFKKTQEEEKLKEDMKKEMLKKEKENNKKDSLKPNFDLKIEEKYDKDKVIEDLEDNSWILENYDILKVLGIGGFGKVFLVKNKKNKKVLALKIIETKDKELMNSSMKEVTNLARLKNHQNILSYQHFYINPVPLIKKKILYQIFIEMEAGESSLDQYLKQCHNRRLSEENFIDFFGQIAKGLKFAHNQQCAHLDLKPGNIIIFKNTCKIADWGGSFLLKSKASTTLKSQSINYTKGYVAPELIDDDYSKKSQFNYYLCDCYSFGMMGFKCCGIKSKLIQEIPKIQKNFHNETIQEFCKEVLPHYSEKIVDLLRNLCAFEKTERMSIEDAEKILRQLK